MRKMLPDLKAFITRGGLYFSGKGRTDVQRQSLRSTVAFISPDKGCSPAIVSDDDGKLQLIENPEDRRESGMEKEMRLEDDQSPQYFNGEGIDRFSDTLAGDALGEFFQDQTEENR